LKLSKYWVGQAKNICVSTNILEKNRLPVGSLAKLKKKKKSYTGQESELDSACQKMGIKTYG
jgi:ribosomal protein L30E